MTEQTTVVKPEVLERFVTQLFRLHGLSAEDAGLVADGALHVSSVVRLCEKVAAINALRAKRQNIVDNITSFNGYASVFGNGHSVLRVPGVTGDGLQQPPRYSSGLLGWP